MNAPKDTAIEVIFARDLAAGRSAAVGNKAVVVIPTSDTWNDFGYKLGAKGYLSIPNAQNVEFQIKILFQGFEKTTDAFDSLLSSKKAIIAQEISIQFCSILTRIESYNEFVKHLGFDDAVSSLRKLGDAVVARIENRDEARLQLIASEPFHLGALRGGSAYQAYRRGRRHLSRFLQSRPVSAPTSFVVSANLPCADEPYEVNFNFEHDELLRNRMAVIVGRNGSGKTQFILEFIEQLQTSVSTAAVTPDPILGFRRVLVFSAASSDPYPRDAKPWSGFDYEYFSMTASKEDGSSALTAALADCLRDDATSIAQNRLSRLKAALRSFGIADSLFLPLIEPHGIDRLPEAVTWNDQRYYPLTQLNEQRKLWITHRLDWTREPIIVKDMNLRNLSSGKSSILRFAAQALSSVESNSILILDEPETHLHPNFISLFVTLLDNILADTTSIAIIVTHSAYIVREVPRQRVHIFTLDDRTIKILMPRLQTFGASIDTITQFVFNDTNVSHHFQDTLVKWIDTIPEPRDIKSIVEKFGPEMNPETLSYVARILKNTD